MTENEKDKIDLCFRLNFRLGPIRVDFNPVVTIVSIIIIWGFVAWAIATPTDALAELKVWQDWVTSTWTWLYIGTQDFWAVFIFYLYFSKYSKMKLGRPDDKPEFSDTSYFVMLFAAGVGIGLFYFGVAEPIWHYAPGNYGNRWWDRYTDNQRAQDAINVTLFHWGIHGWIVYVLVGLLLGFIAHRHNLPMTMRTCFYPLMGDRVFGLFGDMVDILSVVSTMFGVCTSLGLGAVEFNGGIHRLFGAEVNTTNQIIIIWGITACATVSVITGLKLGIRDMVDILSVVSTMFGVCTSLGLGAVEFNGGIHRLFGAEANTTNQIIIIWGITACTTVSVITGLKLGIRRLSELCFGLGMFILLIVFFYDETWHIMNVIVQSIGYYFQWIIQIGFHTDAFAQQGNSPDKHEASNWMNEWTMFYWGWWIAWSPFVGMFIARISKGRTVRQFITYTLTCPIIYCFMWFCTFGSAGLNMERLAEAAGITKDSEFGGKYSNASWNGLFRLSTRNKTDQWFDLMDSYEGISTFLAVLSLIGILLYFVTSSDSGSLVIDCLSANGSQDPPIIQRVFWALTEGACATALLYAGGESSLKSLQSVSICAGLFYTMVLNFMCVALWRSIKKDAGEFDPENSPKFATQLLDPFYVNPTKHWLQYVLAIVAPWWGGGFAAEKLYGGKRVLYSALIAVPFYLWLLLMLLIPVNQGLMYVAWAVLFGMFAYLTGVRANIRDEFGIHGNMAEDFFSAMLAYPLTVIQLENHMHRFDVGKKHDIENPEKSHKGSASHQADKIHRVEAELPMKPMYANPAFQSENGPPADQHF